MEIRRCGLRSLSMDDRMKIGNHELKALKKQTASGEILPDVSDRRKKTIVDFISGISNRIDSDGVTVEFFVERS